MIVFGGISSNGARDDVWVLSLTGTPHWRHLFVGGDGPPPALNGGGIGVYDPTHNRLVVVNTADSTAIYTLDLDGPFVWSRFTPAGTPPSTRSDPSVVYDSVHDRIWLYGGGDPSSYDPLGGLWALDLSGTPTWSVVDAGPGPSLRTGNALVFDPTRDRLVLFGGIGSDNEALGDLWVMQDGATPAWAPLSPSGGPPVARDSHGAVYDADHDRMLMFGGSTDTTDVHGVWSLDFNPAPTWSLLPLNGDPLGQPSLDQAVFDAAGNRVLTYGGTENCGDGSCGTSYTNVLSLDGTPTWSEFTDAGVPPRRTSGQAAILDPTRDRMVVWGGLPGGLSAVDFADDRWRTLNAVGTPPTDRWEHTAVLDPSRDRMLVFGGESGNGPADTGVWALSLSDPPTWSPVATVGTPPPARSEHTAIYDPVRDRMIVYGGISESSPTYGGVVGATLYGDVWALSLSDPPTWTPLAPSGTPPPPRRGHTAIYDPVRDRMVIFGGDNGVTTKLGDVWALDLSGGTAWSALSPTGTPPAPRLDHSAVYDPVRDRIVFYGGWTGDNCNSPVREEWALSLSGTPAWTQLAPYPTEATWLTGPGKIGEHVAVYDPLRDRMVLFGGRRETCIMTLIYYDAAWALAWSPQVLAVAPAASAEAPRLHFAAPYPNPARSEVVLRLAAPLDRPTSVTVHDLSGRRVRALTITAGATRVAWDLRDDAGHRAPVGLYFVHARSGAMRDTRQVIVLR
jgi:hypothetical protein